MLAALDPVVPMPTHVAASSAHGPAGLISLVAAFPAGELTAPPLVFEWSGPAPAGPTSLVLFAPDYRELARFDGIVGSPLPTPAAVVTALDEHGLLHWRVESGAPGAQAFSPLQTFVIR